MLTAVQMVIDNKNDEGHYAAHSRGVSAILSINSDTLDLILVAQVYQVANPSQLDGSLRVRTFTARGCKQAVLIILYQSLGLFCPPATNPAIQSLDTLIRRLRPILRGGRDILANPSTSANDIRIQMEDAIRIHEEYSDWPSGQPDACRPTTIGYFDRHLHNLTHSEIFWPGPVEVYFDCKSISLPNRPC